MRLAHYLWKWTRFSISYKTLNFFASSYFTWSWGFHPFNDLPYPTPLPPVRKNFFSCSNFANFCDETKSSDAFILIMALENLMCFLLVMEFNLRFGHSWPSLNGNNNVIVCRVQISGSLTRNECPCLFGKASYFICIRNIAILVKAAIDNTLT